MKPNKYIKRKEPKDDDFKGLSVFAKEIPATNEKILGSYNTTKHTTKFKKTK